MKGMGAAVMKRRAGRRVVATTLVGLIAMTVAVSALFGVEEAGVRSQIRATARAALALFVVTFSASSVHRLTRTDASKWLLRHRRYFGVSFALAFAWHLAAVATLAMRWPTPFFANEGLVVTIAGGGLAYVFAAAMTVTSTDAAVRRLGARRWKILHKVGSYYIWLIFFQSYLGRALDDPLAAALVAVLLLTVLLRAVAARQKPRAAASR